MNVRINKWLDLIDRVAWTFIASFVGTWSAFGFDVDWDVVKAALVSAAITAAKVVVGQNVGNSPIGDVIPGASVVEPVSKKG